MFNWIISVPLLTLFASVTLVLAIIPSTRRETSRPTLNALLIVVSAWAFSSFMFHSIAFPSSLFWMYLIIFCGLATGAVGVHFCVRFTEQTGAIAKWVVATFYVLCSLPLVPLLSGKIVTEATLLPNGAVEIVFGPIAPFLWSIISLTTLIAIALLVVTLHSSSRSGRKYVIYTLVGYILMCLGSLSNLFVSSYPVDIAANFIFISLVTYAVVSRYALRPSLRQTWYLSLPVIGLMLALCYVAVLTLCLKWLELTTGTAHPIAAVTVIIFGSGAFSPSRMYLLDKLKLYFFPDVYRYQKALSNLAHVDRSLIRWGDSVVKILDIIAKATSADDAVLLIRNSKLKCFEARYAIGRDPTGMLQLRFPIDSPLVKTLVERGAALSTEEIGQQSTLKVSLRGKDDTLREIGAMLYRGVQGYDGLVAIVALTHKSPHHWERTEDRDFLELACRQIAPIIINANLYQESQLEIKERKQMEEALRESQELYRAVMELGTRVGEAIVLLQDDERGTGMHVYMNDVWCDITGYSREELLDISMADLIQPRDRDTAVARHVRRMHGENIPGLFELSIIRKNGTKVPVEITYAHSTYKGKSANAGFIREITERKQAEKKLIESQSELRSLSSHLQAAREEERTTIAREIHDELGQALTAIKIDVSWIRDRLYNKQKHLFEKSNAISGLIDETISKVQRISSELRPSILDDLGLNAAVEWLVEEFQKRTEIECQLSLPDDPVELGQERNTALFRILQESLINISRHAEATGVRITLRVKHNMLELEVIDNGKGIETMQIDSSKSFGLISMRERAYALGGEISISGIRGKGTTINVHIPLN